MQQAISYEKQNAALDALVDLQRADARSFAAQCRLLVELDRLSSGDAACSGVPQFLVIELAGSLRLGQQAAALRLIEAARLVDGLPRMLAALEQGELLVPQIRIVLAETRSCDLDVLRRLDQLVMPGAAELASTDLRRLVRRTLLEVEAPDDAATRLETARAARRVSSSPGFDGMGTVNALLTAEQVARFHADLSALERMQRAADRESGVERTADQRRADLFAALPGMVLAGGFDRDASTRPVRGIVLNVHVPVTTVLEHGSSPGFVDGYGEISSEHVRLLTPHASLRPVYVDGDGQPVSVGATVAPAGTADRVRERVLAMLRPVVHVDEAEPRHDPSAALARLVDVRDRTCRGPGCSGTRCDRDHLVPWPLGPTAVGNLGLKSRRCHAAKHAGWTMVRHPDGSVTWSSPLGRTYSRPSPHIPVPPAAPHRMRRPAAPEPRAGDPGHPEPPPF